MRTFYTEIQPIHTIVDITKPAVYHDVPDDWLIALTDVKGSTKAIQAGRYKEVNALSVASIAAIFNEKFDGTLRMIISGTIRQREQLQQYLHTLYEQGKLVYGLHHSRNALVTCTVQDYFGDQVHFVDGSEGGYALAALQMKDQMKKLAIRTQHVQAIHTPTDT